LTNAKDIFHLERPVLTTATLALRPLSQLDSAEVAIGANDPRIAATTLNIPYPYTVQDARDWISTHSDLWQQGHALHYGIFIRKSGEFAGTVSLAFYKNRLNAELAYWISPPFWKHGLCTAAARAVIQFGFQNLGLNKIKAHHMPSNPASGRVMEKSGMLREGLFLEEILKDGKFIDLVAYGLPRSVWLKQRATI
jgi:RimJ/RimL family protein N-acetyltransferase